MVRESVAAPVRATNTICSAAKGVFEEKETLTLFAVNKDLDNPMELSCDLPQFEGYRVKEHVVLTHSDVKAVNTEENPFNVIPRANGDARVEGGILKSLLCSKSFHMIRLEK